MRLARALASCVTSYVDALTLTFATKSHVAKVYVGPQPIYFPLPPPLLHDQLVHFSTATISSISAFSLHTTMGAIQSEGKSNISAGTALPAPHPCTTRGGRIGGINDKATRDVVSPGLYPE